LDITLDSFAGEWLISRKITDDKGPDASFTGVACFNAHDGGLQLEETGQMHLGGQSFNATRRYIWRAQGAEIAVYFDDGRFFHRFQPGATVAAAHWCHPDDYRVIYDFDRWPEWRSTWRVTGPRKAYRMESLFQPVSC